MKDSLERISAMLLRYYFLLRSSWPRLIELAFWPTLEMLIWGFTSHYFASQMSNTGQVIAALISGALLWDFLIRAQLGVSMSFLEELWSRNLGHLFISPIRTHEWMAALVSASVMRSMLSVVPAALLATAFYHYDPTVMGVPLVAFVFLLLMMGWWFGFLVIAVIMRFGQGAEVLAWMMIYAIAPISAVFYPVASLPEWLQPISLALPSSHIFEGMRAALAGQFTPDHLWWALGLNIVYMLLGILALRWSLHNARNRGALLVVGE
jgi:ABC-2 type transport system permease protein